MSASEAMGHESKKPLRILILGASFGSLLGMRIAAAGHKVTFVCREQEAVLINDKKIFLRLPAKGQSDMVEIGAAQCPIAPDASAPGAVDPGHYDLVCLAMQEPQYSATGMRELIGRIAASGTPCLSIMNMPLPPFLSRITAMDDASSNSIFAEAGLWAPFDPSAFTMASADPQAIPVAADDALITSVTLATNFKVAPFAHERHQLMLQQLATDIDASRIDTGGGLRQPCVRLRPHTSIFVPLAKWPMLVTGNFRCLTQNEPMSIAAAVCADENESRNLYEWLSNVCRKLGTEESTMVPFDRYLAAARDLSMPSSVARAIHAGATAVERVDMLIQVLANRIGLAHPTLDKIVADVSDRLAKNRAGL